MTDNGKRKSRESIVAEANPNLHKAGETEDYTIFHTTDEADITAEAAHITTARARVLVRGIGVHLIMDLMGFMVPAGDVTDYEGLTDAEKTERETRLLSVNLHSSNVRSRMMHTLAASMLSAESVEMLRQMLFALMENDAEAGRLPMLMQSLIDTDPEKFFQHEDHVHHNPLGREDEPIPASAMEEIFKALLGGMSGAEVSIKEISEDGEEIDVPSEEYLKLKDLFQDLGAEIVNDDTPITDS
jgi:hypothetical protein